MTERQEDSDTSITLSGSESTSGHLDWNTSNAPTGTYTVRVKSDDDTQSFTVKIHEPGIPDSVIHRYIPDEFTTSQWPDEVGNSDIDTINGLTYDSSAFSSDGGVTGDGSSHGTSDTMGSFGSSMDTNFALSFGISTTNQAHVFGLNNSNSATAIMIRTDGPWGTSAGTVTLHMRDDNNDDLVAESSTDVTDGSDYVVLINKTGNSATDIEFYVDDHTTDEGSGDEDQGFSNPGDFDVDMAYFARNNGGTIDGEINAKLSEIFWFNSSLSESERSNVFDAYSWHP